MSLSYTSDLEKLLKKEAEIAQSMSILHSKSHIKYNRLSVFINIPVIVLSSVVGFLSTLSLFTHQGVLLGGISILIGIIKTLDSYFDFTKRSETHRIISLSYNKIFKFIEIQLNLEKKCRINAKDLLDLIVNDIQALHEQEPIITKDVINEYNRLYKDELVAKPYIVNGLTSININQFIDDNIEVKIEDIKKEVKKPVFKV